eukprot:gene5287-5822_t
MSGLPIVSLDEEIQFLKSVVIPSFAPRLKFGFDEEKRSEWMKLKAERYLTKEKADEFIFTPLQPRLPRECVVHVKKYKQIIQFTTYEDLVVQVERVEKWSKLLKYTSYQLKCESNKELFLVREDVSLLPAGPLKIVVVFTAQRFSTAAKNAPEAFSSIGLLFKAVNIIPRRDDMFPCCSAVDLPPNELSVAVDKVLNVLNDKASVVNLKIASEYTMREFISPILIEVVLLCVRIWKRMHPDTQSMLTLVCERLIVGQEAHGPVDYSILFDWFDLILTEAKRDDLDAGIVQNYLQLFASKQFTANTVVDYHVYGSEKKRKYEEAFQRLATIPSYGIVSTGYKWALTSAEGGRIELSNDIKLDLEGGIEREALSSLVSRIVAIVLRQMTAVTESEALKKISAQLGRVVGLSTGEAVIKVQSQAAYEFETQMEQPDEYLDMLGGLVDSV